MNRQIHSNLQKPLQVYAKSHLQATLELPSDTVQQLVLTVTPEQSPGALRATRQILLPLKMCINLNVGPHMHQDWLKGDCRDTSLFLHLPRALRHDTVEKVLSTGARGLTIVPIPKTDY